MQKLYDDVLIFCPEVKTGGPEALHQLGYEIARLGGTAHMVYYAPFSRLEIEGDLIRCHAEASPMHAHFAQYHPAALREARLGPRTLVVFPETLAHLAAVADAPYQRALWWLSLDNALPQNPAFLEPDFRRQFFEDAGLAHFHQSDYVKSFLQNSGARQFYPLSDYTDQEFVHRAQIASENPPVRERARRICYFPNKGAELAAQFIAARGAMHQDAAFVPIVNMSKPQVRETLFGAQLYIDFGGHPGKDRVPREAAIAGAVVLLHAAGAARFFADHPLPREYLFSDADIASGRLHRQVDEILREPELHWRRQRFYRDAILLERDRFTLEVRACFFTGP